MCFAARQKFYESDLLVTKLFSWRLQQIFLNTTWHPREKVNFRTCYSLPCNSWDVELHEKFSKFIYYVCFLIFFVVFFLTLRNPPGGMVNGQLQDLMIYNNLETDCSQSLCHFSFFLEWIENVSKDPPVKVDLETEVSEPFSLKEVHMLILLSQTLNLDKNFKQL